MKLKWIFFVFYCLLIFALFARTAEHKSRVNGTWADHQVGKGLSFFLGAKAAAHFQKTPLKTIYAGLLPQGARNTGHFGILLEFEDNSYIMAHKGADRYAANSLDMLRLMVKGMKQRVEILHFKDSEDLEMFAGTLGWRFVKVDVEQPTAVKEAFVKTLDRFYQQKNQWIYSLVQENCMMFGFDLIEAGKPLYWSRNDVFSVIPADAFAKIIDLEPGKIL